MHIVRGHSFSPSPPLPSVSLLYIIPQRCLQISPNIFKHLQALLSSPYPLLFFPLFFLLLLWYLCQTDSELAQTLTQTLPMTLISIFILTYVYFYLHFYLHFPMLPCLTFISGVLIFLSHIVIDHPLAGLYPFLLGSPARCAKYCNYQCQ